jgi:dUTP pyrophosphatase
MQDSIEVFTTLENKSSLPEYGSPEAAGADLKADIEQPLLIKPGCRALIPTGLKFAIPPGYEIQIRPRSGMALKHGVIVLNTPGTIDSDYRGEVKVILINLGQEDFEIKPQMRIAQMILAEVKRARFTISSELEATQRGDGGFGHTGMN